MTSNAMNTDLSAPVDVYYDWVDACDTVAQNGGGGADAVNKSAENSYRDIDVSSRPQPMAGSRVDREMEDFVENDELDDEE